MTGFAIIGASGNILKGATWTPSLEAIEVGINQRQRTYLDHISDKPTYVIANGEASDFHTLSRGNGFPVAPNTQLWFRSRIWHSTGTSSRIIVIEYDNQKRRLNENVIVVNNDAILRFREKTRFALITVRISGRGRIAFTELQAHLDEASPGSDVTGVEHFKLNSLSRENNLELQNLRGQVKGLEDAIQRLSQQLDSADDTIEFSAVKEKQSRNARLDGTISNARESFLRQVLLTLAESLPVSNGSRHFKPLNLSIGIIADESMYNFYKDSCREVHYLSPSNYHETLERANLDAIIYVTCWKGLEDDEWRGIKFREKPVEALDSIIAHARSNGIPTVFQSIEDPSNFEYFVSIAMKFDHVFTSDVECIDKYRLELGHDRVYYGEYGANPMVNNPIGSFRHDIPRVLFSGSYPERYPERTRDMRTIFSSIPDPQNRLTIVDRNFDSDEFHFPAEFQESILGALPHDKLQKVHKLFRYSLNFNSIKESPTMCAMRVYELQAQGKPLVSNYARSVFNKFPEIRIVPHASSIHEITLEQPCDRDFALAQNALTKIMTEKTSFHVVTKMFEKIGLKDVRRSRSDAILVVAIGDLANVFQIVQRQKHVNATVISEQEFADLSLDELCQYGYVAAISSNHEYSDYYLAGRFAGFVYTDSDFVTQKAQYQDDKYITGLVHEYTDSTDARELTMVSTDTRQAHGFMAGIVPAITGKGYALDPYQVGYRTYLRRQFAAVEKESPRLTIVIPIYNNGEYLRTKCFPSIQRNHGWESFEILLIDDGSTDDNTLSICRDLESTYANVRVIHFEDGGSGSASRPRNVGIQKTRTEFITFLDPDNEISVDGYWGLLDKYDQLASSGHDVDFISGYQVKVTSQERVNGLHTDDVIRLISNPIDEFFAEGRFPVISSQAAVIKTDFLRKNAIEFVEKAAGQDTLFGWEILATACQVAFTNEAYIAYYAERDGSVTNDVDARYFQKNLTLEQEQVKRLEKLKILDLYKEHHLDQFFRNWYLERLKLVKLTEMSEARRSLEQIAGLYGRTLEEFETPTATKEDY